MAFGAVKRGRQRRRLGDALEILRDHYLIAIGGILVMLVVFSVLSAYVSKQSRSGPEAIDRPSSSLGS